MIDILKTIAYLISMTLCIALVCGITTLEDKTTEDFHAVRRTKFIDLSDHTKEGIQRKLIFVGVILFFVGSALLAKFC